MDGVDKVLKQAVLKAGEEVKRADSSKGVIEKEGRGNFVTNADLASEKIIIEIIKNQFPNDPILSEESAPTIKNPLLIQRLWVIDPIDGTNNFHYQRNYSAISIGFIQKGIIQKGVVYDPFRNDLFFAEKGKGAFLNNQKIQVSGQADLEKGVIATDNSSDPEGTRKNLKLLLKISKTPWVLMRGSAVLIMCDVAAGRVDLYFHNFLKPWDNAAAFLIAEEAGAKVVNIKGEKTNFLSESVVVGNKALVNQFLKSIKEN